MLAYSKIVVASFVAVAAMLMPTLGGEKRELNSHKHGHVELQIAIDGVALEIALEAPGESIVGFEHAANTEEQKTAVKRAKQQLSNGQEAFLFPAAAGCKADASEIELHQHGNHSEFRGKYKFSCANAAELKYIETRLFALYPSIEEIDADYVSASGQGSIKLEQDAPRLNLAPAS